MWEEGVWCQKFHGASRLGRLFEVRRGEDDNMGLLVGEDQDVQRAVAASLTQATADMEEAERKKRAQIEADTDRFEFSAWLDRAGWAKHLDGLSRAWLLTLVRKPEPREKALNKVCWAVRMVIWKAQQASRVNVVGMAAMNYINRREIGNNTISPWEKGL